MISPIAVAAAVVDASWLRMKLTSLSLAWKRMLGSIAVSAVEAPWSDDSETGPVNRASEITVLPLSHVPPTPDTVTEGKDEVAAPPGWTFSVAASMMSPKNHLPAGIVMIVPPLTVVMLGIRYQAPSTRR